MTWEPFDGGQDPMEQEGHYFIRAASVVRAVEGEVIRDGLVEVRSGKVGRVGTFSSFAAELAGERRPPVLDYGDATLTPGLVDAHCHMTLTGDGSTYEQQVLDPDEMMALISASNLLRHLSSGVTTIRDNGGRNRVVFVVREAVRRGYLRGPRMLLAGRPVTHSGGHFHWCNGVADGEEQIRATVRRLVAEGADHIKVMASGGGTVGNLPYYPSYTSGELRVAVETAHGLGRLTTAHCRATSSMTNAVEAGLDCIEHAEFLTPESGMTAFGGGIAPSGRMLYDPKVTEQILSGGQFVSFTAQTGGYESLLRLRKKADHEALSSEESVRRSALESYLEMKLEVLSSLLRDGMGPRLAISTDAGPFDVSFGGLQHGLEIAVAAGMDPVQAITAATSVAATACGVGDHLGSLVEGKEADLLVVRGDATRDVSAMWEVAAVYQAGRLVAPLVADSIADRRTIELLPSRVVAAVPDC